MQSPRRRGATFICLCSMLMSCYISEQRWMQLIDCDAAINCSWNRTVPESNLSTDRRRWLFQGCRHPNCSFSFRLLHACTLTPPHAFSLHPLLLSLNGRLCPPPTSKGADQSAGCPFPLQTAVAAGQIGWSLFLSRAMGLKCDISPQAAALLCMKLQYWLAELSLMVKVLSFRR